MKAFGFLLVFLMVGAVAFMYLGSLSKMVTSSIPGTILAGRSNAMTSIIKSRKLKDNSHSTPTFEEVYTGDVSLEDYRPIDPVPSSKSRIHHGTIQHGTPLMPYIPRPPPPPPPPPPSRPKHVVFFP